MASKLIVSTSGVRGVVGDSLTADLVHRWGTALGSLHAGELVVVGRDARPSGGELSRALMDGIVSSGADVADAGLCSTPTVEMAVGHLGAAGGAMITASHNPPEYNGLKFFDGSGVPIGRETADLLRSTVDAGGKSQGLARGAVRKEQGLVEVHVEKVLAGVPSDRVKTRRYKAVIDGCSSVGGPVIAELLKRLGCDVVEIDCEPTGDFRRTAEPRPEALGELSEAVVREKADVGFATDPDGDRLCAASADGRVLSEEYAVPLAALHVLPGTSGEKVAVNLSTSRMIEDIAAGYSASVVRSPVGERNVIELMRSCGALMGGEGNGGVIVPALNPCRDGAVAAAHILAVMAETDRPLAVIAAEIPSYVRDKRKIDMSPEQFHSRTDALSDAFAGADFDDRDGLRASWPDRWVHIRPSNTEPIVRFVAEGKNEAAVRKLMDTARKALG